MPGRTKKSTKKFEKNHLKDTIDKRKETAKIKQRQQIKVKKEARKVADRAKVSDHDDQTVKDLVRADNGGARKDLSKMSVDEFFQGGFNLPEQKKRAKPTDSTNRTSQKTGKRKRGQDDDRSDTSEHEDASSAPSNDGLESGEEDGFDTHKEDLDALADKDPEFYKYLKENDAELLNFNEDTDPIDEMSEGEAPSKRRRKTQGGGEEKGENSDIDDGSEVTMAMVGKWKAAMSEQHSLRAMRQVVLAFRAAAYTNSEDDKDHKYLIPSPEVYHELLVTALEHVSKVLSHHLPAKETLSGKVRIATDSKKYRTLTPLLKTYASSIHHLMETLSDSPTIKLTLSSLLPLLPYLLSFKKVLKALIKAIIEIWSDSSSDEATRITAFLLIRRLTLISDASLREAVLKTTYQGLVKGSRITNIHSLPGIHLMKNSAAELWGLDPNIGYTTGFVYIRQLAVHLRTSITHPTKESYKTIYNWQYTHSLDFWSRVLSTNCSPITNLTLKRSSDSPLHPLIYPLVQITLGALRLIPTPTYFPLRFHLTRSLLRLSRTTNTYIPLASPLLEVLASPDLSKPPKPSTLPPLDFSVALRAPKTYLRTRIYQDGLGQQVQELLAEFFGCWAKHVAFPELIIPPSVTMKRWLKSASAVPSRGNKNANAKAVREGKGTKNAKLNALISLLLQKLSANVQYIESRRAQVSFGPSDREGVENFLNDLAIEETPLGAFVEGMRKQREEKDKIVEEGRKEEEMRRGNEGKGNRRGKVGLDKDMTIDMEDEDDMMVDDQSE